MKPRSRRLTPMLVLAYKEEVSTQKPLVWVATSLEDLRAFPEETRRAMGYALRRAQDGQKSPSAKPLKGFGGAGVLEIVESFDGNAFRTVYTTKLGKRIYVLHAFQKKSKAGIKTPPAEIEKVRQRLKQAEEIHAEYLKQKAANEADKTDA
jgi:phage-related protein